MKTTSKVARNTIKIEDEQDVIFILLKISQCFMAEMRDITVSFHMI